MVEEERIERSRTVYKGQNTEKPHFRDNGDMHNGMGYWTF